MYQNQEVAPHSSNDLLVSEPVISNSACECGAVTGERLSVTIDSYCNTIILDCTCIIKLRGAINKEDRFPISHKGNVSKTYSFIMPSSSTNLTIDVYEGDLLLDDKCASFSFSIPNVTQSEKNACSPIVPPIDVSKIDLTSVLVGASVGGVVGLISDGKSGAIQFGLLGGVVALAYGYLTSTQQ